MLAGAIAVSGMFLSPPASPVTLAGIAQAQDLTGSQTRSEAEEAWLTGGPTGAAGDPRSSGGYVTGFTKPGAEAVFAVEVPADGAYRVTLRYANGARAPKVLVVWANGLQLGRAVLAPTGGWTAWANQTDDLSLRAGLNTLAYSSEGGGKANLNLDSLTIAGGSVPAARGATVPYVEYEAESARTNGVIIGPDRIFGDLAAEASGRKAVTLRKVGQFVEFTLRRPANGMVVRYSIPDSAKGTGITAPLGLYVNGRFRQALTLTSKYTWLYGSYPFTNNPAGLGGHHFYDETHLLFPSTLPAGTTVRLQVDPGDTAPSYTIDLADFEQVPAPYREPAGYLSLASFGADPTGVRDATAILQ
ncbi:MAG: carbohydrate-binding protein, partial [Chloroflexota bacterium]